MSKAASEETFDDYGVYLDGVDCAISNDDNDSVGQSDFLTIYPSEVGDLETVDDRPADGAEYGIYPHKRVDGGTRRPQLAAGDDLSDSASNDALTCGTYLNRGLFSASPNYDKDHLRLNADVSQTSNSQSQSGLSFAADLPLPPEHQKLDTSETHYDEPTSLVNWSRGGLVPKLLTAEILKSLKQECKLPSIPSVIYRKWTPSGLQ